MSDFPKLDALPANWREQLADMPDIERAEAIRLVARLERVPDQVSAFLLARDLGGACRIIVRQTAELKDLRARRVETISTILRDQSDGRILGSITERVAEGKP